MIDLATITATLARDRVAQQFAGPAATGTPAQARVRRAATETHAGPPLRRGAVRALRAVADRLEPAAA